MTREEAIKWIDDRMCFGRGTFTEHHPPNIDECWQAGMMAIEALSAEAVRGEWIIRTDNDPICRPWYNTCKCSKCGQYGTKVWNYCPSCGAKMNGGEEDD